MKRIGGKVVNKLVTKKEVDIEDLMRMQIDNIRQMRSSGDAPVDTMGCHKLADPLAKPEVHRFQVLLSLMLSSQTKDEVTAAAMHRLKEYGCTVEKMLSIEIPDLEKLLYPVGFYKKKAVYIKKASAILKERHEGDVPSTLEGLCALPGVGPKMAHLVLQIGWDKCEGIAVDTHVHRIVNRLGWMNTSTPEKTREKLQEMLPRDNWSTINPLLVGFGQTICLPVKPKCSQCLCKDICPSSSAKTVKTVKKEMDVKIEVTDEGESMVKEEVVEKEIKIEVKREEDADNERVKEEESQKTDLFSPRRMRNRKK